MKREMVYFERFQSVVSWSIVLGSGVRQYKRMGAQEGGRTSWDKMGALRSKPQSSTNPCKSVLRKGRDKEKGMRWTSSHRDSSIVLRDWALARVAF